MEVPKALPQSHHLVNCPVKGSCTRGTPTECIFCWFFLRFLCVLRNEVFYGGRSANPATNLLERGTQLQEDIRRQLGTRYEWLLDHKELLCPLRGFVFNPAGFNSNNMPSSPGNLVGEMV